VEGPSRFLVREPPRLGPALPRGKAGEAAAHEDEGLGRAYPLDGPPPHVLEGRTQRLVAAPQLGQALLERRAIQRPPEEESSREIVGGARPLEPVPEPAP